MMKLSRTNLVLCTLAIIVPVQGLLSSVQAAGKNFAETNYLVVMEAESAEPNGDWKFINQPLAGFTGTGYIEGVSSGTLKYPVKFTHTGVYHFQWRNAAPHNTEYNDSYMRFTGPSVVVKSNSQAACATSGWIKVFNNAGGDKWAWETKNCDHTSNQVYVHINAAGNYLLEIKYRSDKHKIDRIVLNDKSKVSDTDAQKLTNAETIAGSVTAARPTSALTAGVSAGSTAQELFLVNGCAAIGNGHRQRLANSAIYIARNAQGRTRKLMVIGR